VTRFPRVPRDMFMFTTTERAELHTATLSRLKQWGLVDVVQNHAVQYMTAEDYERKNLHYLLTKRGEAAFEGVQHALSVLASSGALQTAVLDAIADRLDELHLLLSEPGSSDRRVYTTLMELEGHLDALRTNTKQFNSELQRLLRLAGHRRASVRVRTAGQGHRPAGFHAACPAAAFLPRSVRPAALHAPVRGRGRVARRAGDDHRASCRPGGPGVCG
jgi:hypothetical protein